MGTSGGESVIQSLLASQGANLHGGRLNAKVVARPPGSKLGSELAPFTHLVGFDSTKFQRWTRTTLVKLLVGPDVWHQWRHEGDTMAGAARACTAPVDILVGSSPSRLIANLSSV